MRPGPVRAVRAAHGTGLRVVVHTTGHGAAGTVGDDAQHAMYPVEPQRCAGVPTRFVISLPAITGVDGNVDSRDVGGTACGRRPAASPTNCSPTASALGDNPSATHTTATELAVDGGTATP